MRDEDSEAERAQERIAEVRRVVAEAADQLANVPTATFEFNVARGAGPEGRWNGRLTFTFGGQRHGGSVEDAEDAVMMELLRATGRYVSRMVETDKIPGTPQWTVEEAAAARAFAEALRTPVP